MQPKMKTLKPPFPEPGSTIGKEGNYFCLGKLGRGTFAEISKCVDLSYFHGKQQEPVKEKRKFRLVAAKVELSTFKDQGLLDVEAMMLKHLSDNMPSRMIPAFLEHVKASSSQSTPKKIDVNPGVSAIVMEYLAGEDMHQLRDRHSQAVAASHNSNGSTSSSSSDRQFRRLSIPDAAFLCKDVILPLLKSAHECGIIHRDVKPSNCVRSGTSETEREFKLVDFGLSKSFVVPQESGFAEPSQKWDKAWHIPPNVGRGRKPEASGSTTRPEVVGCMRKERDDAEFRGTSMYASLRVHQLCDYCRRDDLWGLLYVFCDLVSGGLPWMYHAANRDRATCQRMKEWVHGERNNFHETVEGDSKNNDETVKDHIEELLKGPEYHMSQYKRNMMMKDGKVLENKLPPVTPALNMSRDERKVAALREAFEHLATLKFFDAPDYDLIENSLSIFSKSSDDKFMDKFVPSLRWKQPRYRERKSKDDKVLDTPPSKPVIYFDQEEYNDPLDDDMLSDSEKLRQDSISQQENTTNENGFSASRFPLEVQDLHRLPLTLQYRLAQVEFNAIYSESIPIHLAFRDWMSLATSLVYDTWDTAKYERGNHRINDDNYQRELYMRLLQLCLDTAKPFGNFSSRNIIYCEKQANDNGSRKKRKIVVNQHSYSEDTSPLMALSKVSFALRAILDNEKKRPFAPPPQLTFNGEGSSQF